mmetsp:Transcript_2399/g.4944  ORF Transcript_2399/g.4944 Transcript_2399/m.4944 type:complete len:87 (+) Transcript_2399:2971-3231(+)
MAIGSIIAIGSKGEAVEGTAIPLLLCEVDPCPFGPTPPGAIPLEQSALDAIALEVRAEGGMALELVLELIPAGMQPSKLRGSSRPP